MSRSRLLLAVLVGAILSVSGPGLVSAQTTTTTTPPGDTTSTTTDPSTSSTSTSSVEPTTSLPFATTVPPPVVLPAGPIDGSIADPAGTPTFHVPTSPGANVPGPSGIPKGLAAVGAAHLAPLQRAVADATSRVNVAEAQLASAQAEVAAADSALAGPGSTVDQLGAAGRDAAAKAARSRARVVNTTVAAFIAGAGTNERLAIIAGGRGQDDARIRLTYFDSILAGARSDAQTLASERDRLDRQARAAADAQAEALARMQHATAAQTEATAQVAQAQTDLTAAQTALDGANAGVWGAAPVVDGIPNQVMDAYVRAAQLTAVSIPSCHIRWWGLAAIGRTESRHAAGRTIAADGTISPPIIGPLLDGSGGFARIGDTDGGRLDGNAMYDAAVGPMQFIPSTWRSLGVDASGDKKADPQNIYDAAYSSARYLCAAARPLPMDTEAGFMKATYSYSGSATYPAISWDGSAPYRAVAAAAG